MQHRILAKAVTAKICDCQNSVPLGGVCVCDRQNLISDVMLSFEGKHD